jgi:DNA repair protein RecN (Recombination protein N)
MCVHFHQVACSFKWGSDPLNTTLSLFKSDTLPLPAPIPIFMLRALSIRHFAIIESLELTFEPGFNAITGETGAGKSILIDALGLILGDRADSTLIASNRDQAELSASFDLAADSEALAWLQDQALDEDDQLIIRRLLSSQGSSRAWINGRSATIGQLAELGALLVEIHGQHEHQQLEKPETQRRLLDQQLDGALIQAVKSACAAWQSALDALEQFELEAGDPAQLELLRFQHRELETLGLNSGEYEELEAEQERLARSDEIRSSAAQAANALDQDDSPSVRGLLLEAGHAIDRVRELDPHLDTIAGLLEVARINVDEAISELERFDELESGDPARLDHINRRLEKSLDLARKHRVQPVELPALTTRIGERLALLDNQDERRQQLETRVATALKQWRQAADALSQARKQAAAALSEKVNQRLAELGMDQARIAIEVQPSGQDRPGPHGQDRISIEFSANPGQPLRSLSKVASGGELSRVSLALMIASRPSQGPLVRVFDEVDAGIGGETAQVIGRFLRQVANGGQTFCVTHLAQVAACAEHQFQVRKSSSAGITEITVQALDEPQRIGEIARMLGSAASDSSQAHAREMLESARKA